MIARRGPARLRYYAPEGEAQGHPLLFITPLINRFRVVDLQSKPLGQEFIGKFHPPAQLAKRVGIDALNVKLQYLGTNMKVFLELDKTGRFSKDKRSEFVVELQQLRASQPHELSALLEANVQRLMALA